MRQPSHRIRSRRLLKLLKELQEDDYTITAPTLLAAKHLLQHHPRCALIHVKIDSGEENCSFETHRNLVPKFIVSQLEEQKLTNRCSEIVSVSPIIAFIVCSLPGPSGRDKGYPALFRWYYAPRHRTYYIFAYLKCDMARRTYTLSELLNLRGSSSSDGILALANNPEFADVLRRSGSESSSASGCKPAATRHKDDSSVTSDELLFKGTMSRRLGRELAREGSRNSLRPPTREPVPESVREPTHGSHLQTEWKYRGRSETETVSTEPIPAPTGVAAQRSEGFQRFYKAVVSPTHVRVTAGGRIVPNTRGPPSPTAKRTNDNPTVEGQNMPDKGVPGKPPLNPVGMGQPIPVVPQLIPGYPPGFQPIQAPVSFVPMTFGTHLPPGLSFAQPSANLSAVNSPATAAPRTADNILKDMHNTKPSEVRNEGYVADDTQGKVEISPPEMFDHTKPYYYNGQIIYPVSAFSAPLGNQMVPVHMVGIPHGISHGVPQNIPHGAAPQPQGHYMQSHPSSTTSTGAAAPYPSSNNGISGVPPVVNHIVPANANFNAATAPPVSSIKLSDITKKQIASFKQSLKYHEDQLQYNRHQIDEKDMETRIQTTKGHIQRFETTLKSQLEYEEAHRKASQGEEGKTPAQSAATAEGNQASPRPSASPERGAQITVNESDEAIRRRIAIASYGLNTNIGEGGKVVFRCPTEPAFPAIMDQTMGPSLPSDAALAPVFHPRGYSSSWGSSKHAREMIAQEDAEKRLLANESLKLNHIGASEQRSMSQSFALPYLAVPHVESNFDAAGNIKRTSSNGNMGKVRPNLGVPYLLGTLPKGVNPRTARDQDYVYKRPLTEEERRARFLYWGKAPKSAVKGLPKFDGKHFYPPSPVKERTAGVSHEAEADRLPNDHRGIGHRQTESDCDPFRPMTPVERVDPRTVTASEDNCTVNRLSRTVSFETQVNSGSEDSQMPGGAPLKYREDSVGASSVGSVDRRSEKSSTKLWQSVLKKGATSSALSSTTAHGLLPHYAGHAAASLSPSLNTNQASPLKDISPSNTSETLDLSDNGGALGATTPEKRDENCPPNSGNSLRSQLNGISLGVSGRATLSPTFNM